jgi:hypothetical protein
MDHTQRLYRISTILPSFRSKKDVEVIWQSLKREQPAAPYAMLIADYENLTPRDRGWKAEYVDSLFTWYEARILCSFFEIDYGLKAEILPVEMIPTPCEPDNYDIEWFLSAERLEGMPGCPLNLSIVGFYSVIDCGPVPARAAIEAACSLPDALFQSRSQDHHEEEGVRRFFRVLGSLTGIYFREEGGELKPTLGPEDLFPGTSADLFRQLREAL